MKSMTVTDINTRLKDRFKLLTGGGTVLLERQQTLRALVDWSYVLLSPEEQKVFARLSVFMGGFDLAAAEVVCGAEPLYAMDVVDLLQSLVEKSLVMLDQREENTRYQVLETIRDYAHEKLEQDGEPGGLRGTHCQLLLRLGEGGAGRPERRGAGRLDLACRDRARQRPRRDRARAARAASTRSSRSRSRSRCRASGLRGYSTEGRKLVAAALAIPAVRESELAQGHALYVGAALAVCQSDYDEARLMLEKCLALRRGLGNPLDIAATLSTLSMARLPLGDSDGARAAEEEALEALPSDRQSRGRSHRPACISGRSSSTPADGEAALKYLNDCLAWPAPSSSRNSKAIANDSWARSRSTPATVPAPSRT